MDKQAKNLKDRERARLLLDAEDKVVRLINGGESQYVAGLGTTVPAVPAMSELQQLILMKQLKMLHPHIGVSNIDEEIRRELKHMLRD